MREGSRQEPLVYSAGALTHDRPSGAMSPMNRAHLTVAVVGATGVVGRTMIAVLNEREFPVGELRLLASGRSAGRTLSIDGSDARDRRSDAGRLRRRRYRAVLGRRRRLEGARAGRRGARCDGHRQLVGVADGPGGPARGLAGQPGRPRGPRGHHRQPELLDDADGAGADGAPRRGRAGAGRRRHLPVRVGDRRRRPGRARGPDPRPCGRRAEAGRGLSPSDRVQRPARDRRLPARTATRRRSGRSSRRTARSSACRTCASRARPSASRSS